MKIFSFVLIIALYFSGCAEKSFVKVVDNEMSDVIEVKDVKKRIRDDGFLEIQIVGENTTDEYALFRYRITWQDKDGFDIPSITSKWQNFPAHKNAEFHINAIAPTMRATDYKVYLNK